MIAPANTPAQVNEKIQRDIAGIAANPEFRREMAVLGYHKLPANTPAQFAAVIRDEVKLTAEMVEAAGPTPD